MTKIARGLCAVGLVFLPSGALRAHEIGTTRVAAAFRVDRRYEIAIVTDAAALVEKLEAAADRPPESDAGPGGFETRLAALDGVFRRRVSAAFDGSAVHPAITYSVSASADGLSSLSATIRLTGLMPEAARTFTWSYGWTFASYALSTQSIGSTRVNTEWLEGGQASVPFVIAAPVAAADRMGTIRRYLVLGFTHIVPHGFDHMLFVLGIFLLSTRLKSVLWQVSAFTIAHSITLGLSIYGVISVPPRIVEPVIAISIAYVAVENLFLSELKPWRVALVFAFGLLHGMGFAGALKDLGLPRSEFLTALVTFNIGVEGGQLAVIAAALLLVGWQRGSRDQYRRRIVVPVSAVIACVAVYWTIERLLLT